MALAAVKVLAADLREGFLSASWSLLTRSARCA